MTELDIFSPTGNDTRELLDWHLIISSLCNNAHFEINQQVLLNSFLSVDDALKSIRAIEQLISYPEPVLFSLKNVLSNIDPTITSGNHFLLLEKFSTPSTSTLNYCAHLAVTFSTARRAVENHSLFKNRSIDEKLILKIAQNIRHFIDPNGNLNFDKHPLLRAQNEKINTLSKQIREKIQFLLRSEIYRDSLAFDQYDIIDDRFVLPIRADNYRYDHGIIISRSQSGQTLLVEPLELRELANKRLRELSHLDEIINKLCINIGTTVSSNFSIFLFIYQTLLELDILVCKTLFSKTKNLTAPEFGKTADFILEDFFHPLIEKPVKNSLHLNAAKKGLLLSGPNTGGKTVTLKSLCLCLMFFRLGLFVPARRASIPIFSQVYFFSHDQQSLEKGLSSFSSESERYLSILPSLHENAFLFIDEIFNSTSSEEASALALGFMNFATSRTNAKLFISSHHHRLKAIIHQNNEYISAHVGFDHVNESPTYKLNVGSPGPSMAITIFKNFSTRFQQSTQIASMAEEFLEKNYVNYEQLLEKLNLQTIELDRQKLQQQQLIKEAHQARSAAEGIIHLEKQKILANFERELSRKIKQAEDLIDRLKHSPVAPTKTYFSELRELKANILPVKDKPSLKNYEYSSLNIDDILIDNCYFHLDLAQNVQVVEKNHRKSKILVMAGTLKLWTEADKLTQPNLKNQSKKSSPISHFIKTSTSSMNIDARGFRLDEFQRITDQALSDLFSEDLPYIEIIHGHGDGILKNWLRKYLNTLNDIEWTTPDGNDGSTIVKIK